MAVSSLSRQDISVETLVAAAHATETALRVVRPIRVTEGHTALGTEHVQEGGVHWATRMRYYR